MKKLIIATILTSTAVAANAAEADHKDRIGFDKAKSIAIEAVKGSLKVVEAELEIDEDGEESYEVEVEAGGVVTEVEINAKTGEVIEMEADD